MSHIRGAPPDIAVLGKEVEGRPTARMQFIQSRLGMLAASVALGASCLYVLLSPLSVTLGWRLSDRSGVGALLFDLIWLALAVAVVGGAATLRSVSRGSGMGGATMAYGDADTSNAALPTEALPGRSHRARAVRPTVPEALGFIAVLAVYHGVFLPGAITWGDWKYWASQSHLLHYFPLPSLWSFSNLGTQNILGLPLAPIEELIGLTARAGMPYSFSERMFFYFPLVILPYVGAVVLLRAIGVRSVASALGGLLFAINTYALGIISGGWGTVGVGYALAPWVAFAALQLYRHGGLVRAIVVGLLVGIQAWYDPREALLSCMAGCVVVVIVVALRGGRRVLGEARVRDFVAAALTLGLSQLHWLLVAIFAIEPALPTGYTSISWLQVLSYQTLGDGLGIFRPFWPFEVFPGTPLQVLPSVWMAVPIIAALALLRRPGSAKVVAAGAVYLVFSALVSGATAPFGPVNSWLFSLPGLDVFRDPSPYFGPAALAAAVLVGVGLDRSMTVPRHRPAPPGSAMVSEARASELSRFSILQGGAGLMLVGMLAIGGFPAVSARLGDNLAPQEVPTYDLALANYLSHKPSGAVLWLPDVGQFLIRSRDHPSVSAWDLAGTAGVYFPPFPSTAPLYSLTWLSYPSVVADVVQRYGIRYVVLDTSPSAYQLRSVPSGAAVRLEYDAFAGLSHRAFGPLVLYRVHSATGAPFSLVSADRVVDRQPAALQEQLSGLPVSVASPRGSHLATAISQAFFTELGRRVPGHVRGKPTGSTTGYLAAAEPVQRYSVVEAELQGGSLMLRDIPTIASVDTGTRVLARAPHVPWQRGGVLGSSELRRGVVISVGGIAHYVSWSALAGKRPVVVASVPTSGSWLPVTTFRLGRNLLGAQSFRNGLDAWGSLGNENNWQHFATLNSAGIAATPGGLCGSGTLTLTARLDAAGIDHALVPVAGTALVVGAQVRRLEGSPPMMNGLFQGGQVLRLAERMGSGSWASVSSVVSGQLTGLQFEVFQGQHGRSVACLRDPSARRAVALGSTLLSAHVSIVPQPLAPAPVTDPVTYQPPPGLAGNLELLSTTSFGKGLGAWGSLGDEDNYNHDTLRKAGISAKVTRVGGEPALHLTVSSGAAGIDQPYVSWASSNVYRLSVTYKTFAGASLTADLYPRVGYPPAEVLGLASSGGQWVTKTVDFYMPSTLSTPATVAGTLELVLWPAGSGSHGSASIRHLSLQQVVPQPVVVQAASEPPSTHGSGYVTPRWSATPAGADAFTVSVPAHKHTELLVFWQSYSTGWKAVDSTGKTLVQVKVNGWANGYLIGRTDAVSHVEVVYQPQRWEVIGLLIELAAITIAGAALLILAWRTVRRRRRLPVIGR